MTNREAIDQYFLISEQEEVEQRARLAALGPAIVDDVVYCLANALRSRSEDLNDYFAGPFTERLIKHIFERAADLLLAVIGNASPGSSAATALRLAALTQHADARMRALACMFAGLAGIPAVLVALPLARCLREDEDMVVKLAAAAHLQSQPQMVAYVDPAMRRLARRFVTAYVESQIGRGGMGFGGSSFKETEEEIDFAEEGGIGKEQNEEDENTQMKATMNAFMLIQRFPILATLQNETH